MDQWCNFLFLFFPQNEEKSESYPFKLFIRIRKIKILLNYISKFEELRSSQFIYPNLREFEYVLWETTYGACPYIFIHNHVSKLSQIQINNLRDPNSQKKSHMKWTESLLLPIGDTTSWHLPWAALCNSPC